MAYQGSGESTTDHLIWGCGVALLTMVLIAGAGLLVFAGLAILAGVDPTVVTAADADVVQNFLERGARGQFALAGLGLLILAPLAGLAAGLFTFLARS